LRKRYEKFHKTNWKSVSLPDPRDNVDFEIYQLVKVGYSQAEAEAMTHVEATKIFCFSQYDGYIFDLNTPKAK